MRKLKFPSYEYINSLDFKSKEYYDWILFELPVNVYGRFYCACEEGDKIIYFDVVENGECDVNVLGMNFYFNEKNYKEICEHAQKIFESFYKALDKDCSHYWEKEAKESIKE